MPYETNPSDLLLLRKIVDDAPQLNRLLSSPRNSYKLLQQACRPPRHPQASLSPSPALPLQKSKSRISEKVHSRTDKLESPYHPRCGGSMPLSRPTLSVTRTRTALVHNVYFFLSSTCAWYMMHLKQLRCRTRWSNSGVVATPSNFARASKPDSSFSTASAKHVKSAFSPNCMEAAQPEASSITALANFRKVTMTSHTLAPKGFIFGKWSLEHSMLRNLSLQAPALMWDIPRISKYRITQARVRPRTTHRVKRTTPC